MMRFDFTQIYAEIGTSFKLSHMLLNPLIHQLDALGRTISLFEKRFKGEDFVLDVIISATRKSDQLAIKGPLFLNKKRRVEYSIFIPFFDISDHTDRTVYALEQVSRGLIMIFEKYETDSSGIADIFGAMIAAVKESPDEYLYHNRL